MNCAAFLGNEVDVSRIRRRKETGYLDTMTERLDEAWKLVTEARDQRRPLSVGLLGNCADILPEMVRRGWIPDDLADQACARHPLSEDISRQLPLDRAAKHRHSAPDDYASAGVDR